LRQFALKISQAFIYPFRIALVSLFFLASNQQKIFAQSLTNLDSLIALNPSKQWIVHGIYFEGNKTTKPKIIEREMSIHKHYIIPNNELASTLSFNQSRILNLQLFTKVLYRVEIFSKDSIDVYFEVSEYFYWIPEPIFGLADRNFNVWWNEQGAKLSRTNLGMTITRMNFRGRNERLGATVQIGYNKFFDAFYKIPYIDRSLKHGLGISATYQTGREINYATDSNKLLFYASNLYPYKRFQTELTYTFRPGYAFTHEVNLSFNNYTISPELYLKNPNYLGLARKKVNYLELKYQLKYNNTNIRIFPTKGIDLQAFVSRKGLAMDKDISQSIAYAELNTFHPIREGLSVAMTFRGRFAFNDSISPYILNRALGFRNDYVRGYEYYVIDGTHFALLRASLRQKVFERTIEQRYTNLMRFIPIRLYAKVYSDVGFVHGNLSTNSFLNDKLLRGYGFGFDLVLAYIFKFRFEYSFNHLKQNELFLHGNKE
jgi:outer membrane protein assembly factor BamA